MIIRNHLLRYFGDSNLDVITSILIIDFMADMRQRKLSGTYINNAVRVLKMLLRQAVERDVLADYPIKKKIPKEKEKPLRLELTSDERARFFAVFDDEAGFRMFLESKRQLGPVRESDSFTKPRRFGGGLRSDSKAAGEAFERFRELRELFVVAIETGLRKSDLRNLRWDQIDVFGGFIRVLMQKTTLEAEIPISRACRDALDAAEVRSGHDEYVFLDARGRRYPFTRVFVVCLFWRRHLLISRVAFVFMTCDTRSVVDLRASPSACRSSRRRLDIRQRGWRSATRDRPPRRCGLWWWRSMRTLCHCRRSDRDGFRAFFEESASFIQIRVRHGPEALRSYTPGRRMPPEDTPLLESILCDGPTFISPRPPRSPMIRVVCHSCQKPLSLDETKLPEREISFPCPVCKTKISIDRRALINQAPADPGRAPSRMEKRTTEQELPGHEFFERAKAAGESHKYDEAMMWYLKGADAGNSWSMCNIGWLYSSGRGVTVDKARAAEWYLRAADSGDSLAMRNLADMCREGTGVPQDYEKALTWYRKGASLGDATCLFYVGWLYDNGWGITQDYKQAMTWYLKAAEQADSSAMRNVGVLYELGQGVPKDEVEASRWYLRAAELGDGLGMRNLGQAYQHGRGVKRDVAEAIRWYARAAETGIAKAYLDLAKLYHEGKDIAANPAEALKWYKKAAKAGDADAAKVVAALPAQEAATDSPSDSDEPAEVGRPTVDPPSLAPLPRRAEDRPFSEFELPNEMRTLITAIYDQLIAPCRAHVSAANQSRVRENRLAQEALTATESRVAAGVARIGQLCKDAEAHLQRNCDLETDTAMPDVAERRDHRPLDTALRELEEQLQSEASQFLSETNLPLWPANGAARVVIVVGTIFLAFQYWPLLFAWPLIVVVSRLIIAHQLTTRFKSCVTLAVSLRSDLEAALPVAKAVYQRAIDTADKSRANRMAEIRDWAAAVSQDLRERCKRLWEESGFAAEEWDSPAWQHWAPDASAEFAARIGTFRITADDLRSIFSDVSWDFSVPALIPFGDNRCLVLEAPHDARAATEGMRSVVVRALATTPPGKARFTFIDPVSLGQNVAEFMALGDAHRDLIGGKAWSEPHHVEQQLAELTEHMETVIQKYLRKDYATIRDYNQAAQEVAEPFRFIVVFDFPVNFTESSARRLVSIVRNGPRCGVYTFIVRDPSKPLPYGFNWLDLAQSATVIQWPGKGIGPVWSEGRLADASLTTDVLSNPDIVGRIMRDSGDSATEAMKVEVPFEKLLGLAALDVAGWWRQSAAKNLKVPLGPTGARKPQYLTLGEGLAHHVLVVGRTGSGKTNLMHVIITTIALAYSPDEVQLYLIDFKGGVGFKPYADRRLPHAAVIAIETEREFGMSVLQRLDRELKQREALFKAAGSGVDDLAKYRAVTAADKPLPRVLVIIDEFQEFFTQDDAIATQARAIFDRIVRQGRSFGLHLLLGTQSLSGAAELSSSTKGQMGVRIALPCSETDAQMILSDKNAAARLLSRPGEGIYNDGAGDVERNSPFQVALFSQEDLQFYLDAVAEMTSARNLARRPMIFEGNEPADFQECEYLRGGISTATSRTNAAWLGEAVAILPPVRAAFARQTARHLLIVDRDEEEGVGMTAAALVSLLRQHPTGTAKFHLLNYCSADAPWSSYCDDVREAFGDDIELLNRHTLSMRLNELVSAVNERLDSRSVAEKSSYLVIFGLHRARDLRASDEWNDSHSRDSAPAEQLVRLLRDGPEAGVHVIAWCDTVSNARRTVDRSLREFGMRVAAAMSTSDSDALLDCADAARLDKPHRALFYDEEKPGSLLKFRPYSVPSLALIRDLAAQRAWLQEAAARERPEVV